MVAGRISAAVVVVALSTLASAGVATADPTEQGGGRAVEVQDCLDGDAGPYDYVFQAFGFRPTATLRCGDPTKGVLHIDDRHPIDDPTAFLGGVQNVFSFGELERPGSMPNTSLYRYDRQRSARCDAGAGRCDRGSRPRLGHHQGR